MSFTTDLQAFARKVEKRNRDIFVGVSTAVHDSVVEGSPLTGAPGQPVDTGNLRASWILRFLARWLSRTSTNVEYAPPIEEGIGPHGPMTLRSAVGGFHSVKLTRAGFQNIVDNVAREVAP